MATSSTAATINKQINEKAAVCKRRRRFLVMVFTFMSKNAILMKTLGGVFCVL